jgi:phosphotriesterase-related protein
VSTFSVETVRGPVGVHELGPTLMHEHIFVLSQETLDNFNYFWGDAWWDEEARVADAIAKLRALRDAGIQTLVDPTAVGLGRDIRRIQRVNAEADLNIVVCTGIYAFLELPGFFKYRSAESLAEFFVRELREGIDDTGVKAAFIKCAVEEHGVIADVPLILSAVAAAAIETGAPVMVHTNAAARTGTLALDTLVAVGVEPSQIVIAHAGDSNDLDYLRALADTGAILGCDRFNIPAFNPDERRIETLVALLEEGYADRIHLGHDAACFYDFMVGNPIFANERPDYLHITQKILPVLPERGVTEEQIETMLVENPRTYFGQRVAAPL